MRNYREYIDKYLTVDNLKSVFINVNNEVLIELSSRCIISMRRETSVCIIEKMKSCFYVIKISPFFLPYDDMGFHLYTHPKTGCIEILHSSPYTSDTLYNNLEYKQKVYNFIQEAKAYSLLVPNLRKENQI